MSRPTEFSLPARRIKQILATLIAIVALSACSRARSLLAATADSKFAIIDRIRIGIAGHYKIGFWTPVEFTITGAVGANFHELVNLNVVVPDGDGVPTSTVEHGIRLQRGKPIHVTTYVKLGRAVNALTASLSAQDNPRDTIERTFSGDDIPPALAATQRLILELDGKLQFGAVARFNEEGQPEETIVAQLDDPSSLPDRPEGYDCVDVAVLTTEQPNFYKQATKTSLAAMRRWVQFGGRLLLSVGSHGEELLAAGAPLEHFAPGRFVKTIPLYQFGALENFVGASQRLSEGLGLRANIPATQLADVRGRVEAFEGNGADRLPLVVRTADSFGELIFVAVDLNAPPINRWVALPQFLGALLGFPAGQSPPIETSASHLGYIDLSGQLHTALDQFPGVQVTPFWLFAVLAIGYVVLLFPFDYWLSGRRSRSAAAYSADWRGSSWPWIGFAVLVACVSLGAWWIARQSKSDRVEVNQAEVVDFDVDSGLMRGNSWFSVFSPTSDQHTISLRPSWSGPHDSSHSTLQLSWFAAPGNGLGSMGDGGLDSSGIGANTAAGDLSLFTQPYSVSGAREQSSAVEKNGLQPLSATDRATLASVPMAAASSKCFTAQWTNERARLVYADLNERVDRQLAGSIRVWDASAQTSRSESGAGDGTTGQVDQPRQDPSIDRDFHLTNCVLFHDRWAYLIPEFSSAQPIDIDRLDPQTADTYFTRRKIVSDRDQTTPYDRTGTDRSRILEIMMFYRAAGGLQYVGLMNRYLHDLDLSAQLGLNRAILIGFGPPASTLAIDDQSVPSKSSAKQLTIYRFIVPVRPAPNP